MAKTAQLSCDTLGDLMHGLSRGIIDEAIAKLMEDMEQRGHDGNKRKLKIEVQVWQKGSSLTLTNVRAKAELPPSQTESMPVAISARPNAAGEFKPALIFELESEQGTLPMDETKTA